MGFFIGHTVDGAPLDLQRFLTGGRSAAVDSGQVLAASNQLKSVEARIFERPTAPLKSAQLIARKFDAGAWATSTSFMTMDGAAKMKPIGGVAEDLEEALIGLDEKSSPVREFGVAYGFGRKELIVAAKLGMPLDDAKARLCMKAYEVLVDELAALGDEKLKLIGLLTEGNGVPRHSSKVGLDSGSSNTDILAFLSDIETSVIDETNETEAPDTIALPLKQHQYIAQTPFNASSDGRSIKEVYLQNSEYIRNVVPWNRLKAAGSKPKGEKKRHIAACFRRLDDTIMRQQIPEAFTTLDPQQQGTRVITNCVASIGSTEIIQPKAIALWEFKNND